MINRSSMGLFSVANLLLKISNPDKVIFGDPEIIKGEGIDFDPVESVIRWRPRSRRFEVDPPKPGADQKGR
ncbi:hypothetical protein [Desulfosporosinus nitroreducens]|uniref:hypothetical protein n=1 Tax=Desulfosporosinus nitroreducens TaxID=2018668 RepID=UPI00207C15C6|nr:hypothetical protein [Desulfosporosinus nitroreducens]MCO1604564.1 hypothetical protein [Desulfosporosinus nitroreducens]